MKRLLSFLLIIVLSFAAISCGAPSDERESVPGSDAETPDESVDLTESESETEPADKTLVVYFSRTGEQRVVGVIEKGNTAIVAECIAEKLGADLYEIRPMIDYPYTEAELSDKARKEQADLARPVIKGKLPDLSQYGTVFVGAPVWFNDWPMIVYTFFERAHLEGKTIVPFNTHTGSGTSGFTLKAQYACPDSTVLECFEILGETCQNDPEAVSQKVDEWLSKIGLSLES